MTSDSVTVAQKVCRWMCRLQATFRLQAKSSTVFLYLSYDKEMHYHAVALSCAHVIFKKNEISGNKTELSANDSQR